MMGGAFYWADDEQREMPGEDDLCPASLVQDRLRVEIGIGVGEINDLDVRRWTAEARACVVDLLDRLKERGLT